VRNTGGADAIPDLGGQGRLVGVDDHVDQGRPLPGEGIGHRGLEVAGFLDADAEAATGIGPIGEPCGLWKGTPYSG
jgi:hypothetical protein